MYHSYSYLYTAVDDAATPKMKYCHQWLPFTSKDNSNSIHTHAHQRAWCCTPFLVLGDETQHTGMFVLMAGSPWDAPRFDTNGTSRREHTLSQDIPRIAAGSPNRSRGIPRDLPRDFSCGAARVTCRGNAGKFTRYLPPGSAGVHRERLMGSHWPSRYVSQDANPIVCYERDGC